MLKVYALAAATIFALTVFNAPEPVEASVSVYENRNAQLEMLLNEEQS